MTQKGEPIGVLGLELSKRFILRLPAHPRELRRAHLARRQQEDPERLRGRQDEARSPAQDDSAAPLAEGCNDAHQRAQVVGLGHRAAPQSVDGIALNHVPHVLVQALDQSSGDTLLPGDLVHDLNPEIAVAKALGELVPDLCGTGMRKSGEGNTGIGRHGLGRRALRSPESRLALDELVDAMRHKSSTSSLFFASALATRREAYP